MFEGVYNDMASVYDDTYTNPEYKAEDEMLFSFLRKKLHGSVLDIGSGTGLLLENIDIPPENYVGVDTAEKLVAVSEEKFPKHMFFNLDFDQCEMNGKFDSIVCLYGAFSYLNPDSYDKIISSLNEGGYALVMMYAPNYSPHYYTDDMTEQVHNNIDYEKVNDLFPHSILWQNKYVVASNQPIDLEDINGEDI